MDINQAIEHANAFVIPGLLVDDQSIIGEVNKNCDAIKTLLDAWKEAPLGQEPVEFSVIQQLADRTRSLCDTYGVERLRNHRGVGLSRGLSNDDLAAAVAKMQRRRPKAVYKTAGPLLNDLQIAYVEKSVSGTVLGIDIETTSRFPELGYIVNVGFEFWNLGRNTVAVEPHTAYFGIPEMYKEKGVPLSDIHQITWKDVEGKKTFRDDKKAQEALLATMKKIPFMAHNAAFEDSWFMFNIDG
ncbi:MAG: 3'-5' exonuclease, partial [Atopobium sp.]|nr:3'-5' exonuclease [Atopobium sp.]